MRADRNHLSTAGPRDHPKVGTVQLMNVVLPPRVRAGDRVRLVSPASYPSEEQLAESVRTLESWGLVVDVGKHALDRHGYMAGRVSGVAKGNLVGGHLGTVRELHRSRVDLGRRAAGPAGDLGGAGDSVASTSVMVTIRCPHPWVRSPSWMPTRARSPSAPQSVEHWGGGAPAKLPSAGVLGGRPPNMMAKRKSAHALHEHEPP